MASTPTRSPNWRRLGHSQSPVIDKVISKKKDLSEAQASFSWMGANLAGAIVAYMERDFALFFGELKRKPSINGLCSCVTGSSVSMIVLLCGLALHGIVLSSSVVSHLNY